MVETQLEESMLPMHYPKRLAVVGRVVLLFGLLAVFVFFENLPARSAAKLAVNAAKYSSVPEPPGPIDFGRILVDMADEHASLEISETGDSPLTIESPLLSGDDYDQFNILTPFPITIPDGGTSQTVDLICSPNKPGVLTAQLTLQTNDPDRPQVTYDLTCEGYVVLLQGPLTTGINGPTDLAVSPDGQHLYAISYDDDQLKVYKRLESSGGLVFVMSYGYAGLSALSGVAISPDGNQVFLTSYNGDALLILDRDPSTGMVSTADVIKQDDVVSCSTPPFYLCSVKGLDGASGLAVSPDGKNIFVAAAVDDAISVFSRSVPTGTVSYLQDFQDSDLGVTGLDGALDVAVSPNGYSVYVVSSPSTTPGAGGAVALFRRLVPGGGLTFVNAYKDGGALLLDRPVDVAVSPNGSQVYVVSFYDNTLMIFDRSSANGTLTVAQSLTNGGEIDGLYGAAGVATSPDGSQIYVAASLDNALTVFEREPLSGGFGLVAAYQDGVSWVEGLASAGYIATSPNGRYVYVSGYADNTVAAFRTLDKIFLPVTIR